jgi:hypothetical protein
VTIEVQGAKKFRKDLRAVDEKANRKMTDIHKGVAKHTQAAAKSNAASGGGAFAKAKSAITRLANSSSAAIGVHDTSRVPFAEATFWGAKGRSGWYAQQKYTESEGRQFPEWVGNTWTVGAPNEGPYVLNYTVAEEIPKIMDLYARGVNDLFGEAFPD